MCYYCSKPVRARALKCTHCGKWYSSGKQAVVILVVAILLSSVGTWYFLSPGESGYQDTDDTPEFGHSIGTGDDEYWSMAVSHPSWIVTAVQTRPQLILTHSTGCAPCDTMLAICGPLSTELGSQIDYSEFTSGTNEPEATDCFDAYDRTDPHYVPLTTIVTEGPNNTIIWHSWEGVVDEAELRSWLEDAIAYHEEY